MSEWESPPSDSKPIDLRGIATLLRISPHTPNQWRQRSKAGLMRPPLPEPDFPELEHPTWKISTIVNWARDTGRWPPGTVARPAARKDTMPAAPAKPAPTKVAKKAASVAGVKASKASAQAASKVTAKTAKKAATAAKAAATVAKATSRTPKATAKANKKAAASSANSRRAAPPVVFQPPPGKDKERG